MKKALSIILSLCFVFINISAYAVTTGERNALASAQTYLSVMNFSYQGIIDMLEYEGYSETECKYAADNCGADWNGMAANEAKKLIDGGVTTKEEIVDQLIFKGYTYQQAVHGAEANGL